MEVHFCSFHRRDLLERVSNIDKLKELFFWRVFCLFVFLFALVFCWLCCFVLFAFIYVLCLFYLIILLS